MLYNFKLSEFFIFMPLKYNISIKNADQKSVVSVKTYQIQSVTIYLLGRSGNLPAIAVRTSFCAFSSGGE